MHLYSTESRKYSPDFLFEFTSQSISKLLQELSLCNNEIQEFFYNFALNQGPQGANLWITLTLTEGKNREVRKVLEALGLTVNRLIRLSYGPFQLGTLAVGEVEEVGPRVIREQLAAHIAPGALPSGVRVTAPPARSVALTGARPDAKPEQETDRGARRAPPKKALGRAAGSGRKADPSPAAPAKTEYKPGWAKPKKRAPRPALKTARPAKDRPARPSAADETAIKARAPKPRSPRKTPPRSR